MLKLRKVRLAEVADLTVGFVGTMAKHYVDDGIPFIRSMNVEPFRINYNDLKYIASEFNDKLSKSKLHQGDVVIVRTGKPGACAVIPDDYEEINCSDLVIVRPHKDELDSLYAACYINYSYRTVNSQLVGAVQQHFNVKVAEKLEINLPSLSEQKKIAGIIGDLNEKIRVNETINKNLEQQAQTLFAEYCFLQDCDSIPNGWSSVTLGDVAYISKETFNPSKQPETMLEHYSIPAFDETRYPVFELSTEIKSNKFIVDSDCFMISKLNPTIKRVWRPYCVSDKAVCSTEFIVYKAKDRKLTDFLYSLIDSAPFSDFMCSHVTGSTGSRQRTTPSDTLQYCFYLPTIDEIADFSAVVAPMYAQIRINALENERLKNLRDSLLPRLMSGEIDVSDIDP